MSWLNKIKGYKPLAEENNSDSQKENSNTFEKNTNTDNQTESNSQSSSENKEEGLVYSLPKQLNLDKLKKIL